MQLFYAPNITPQGHTLSEEESKHCIKVLRLAVQDRLHITDGRGRLYLCQVEEANPKRCRLSIVSYEENYNKLPYELTMAVAPTKSTDRFEWFLEKACEIGLTKVTPIKSSRSERKALNKERCERVLAAAMKQSLKCFLPHCDELTSFAEFIAQDFHGAQLFIAHCNASEEKKTLHNVIESGKNVVVLIGPEGDFSPEEVAAARKVGFVEVSLGTQRLRTETAALMATTMAAIKNM